MINEKVTHEQLVILARKAGERRLTVSECERLVTGIEGMKDTRDVATFQGEDVATLTLDSTCDGLSFMVGGLTSFVPFERVTRLCAVLSGQRFDRSFRHDADDTVNGSLRVWVSGHDGEVVVTVTLPGVGTECVSLIDDAADAAVAWLKAHDPR